MRASELYEEHVDILSIRFPRTSREKAVAWLVDRVARGEKTPLCFPDMSTLNIACRDAPFRRLLQERFYTLNDGAGLAWAARRQGLPLGDNLNGTDFTPLLFTALPAGTRVCLLGTTPDHLERSRRHIEVTWPHLEVVGAWNGYFDTSEEGGLVDRMAESRPQVVLVAMGNPRQVRFINRHVDDPRFAGVSWLAVGGLLDYWAGAHARAPKGLRQAGLEWAWIALTQPHKLLRYALGVPAFMVRCLLAELTPGHALRGTPLWDGG